MAPLGTVNRSRTNPVKRQNLPASIASQLKGQILRGELRPGSRLPGHRELAANYSVSVGSVREAISMLISTGLVETRAGRGTFVADGAVSPRSVDRVQPPLDRKAIDELTEA